MSRNTEPTLYSWHLSLRVDRPLVGCTLKPHAYMYSKKIDTNNPPPPLKSGSLTKPTQPPAHSFRFSWYMSSSLEETCGSSTCKRRHSYSPLVWSSYAMGATGANGNQPHSLVCVDPRRSCNGGKFCNATCFKKGWMEGGKVGSTKTFDDPNNSVSEDHGVTTVNSKEKPPATPVRDVSPSLTSHIAKVDLNEWTLVSTTTSSAPEFTPTTQTVGRRMLVLAEAQDSKSAETLMSRFCVTGLTLDCPSVPPVRTMIKVNPGVTNPMPPTIRLVSYNVLAEIYATGQQYPYCDFWALAFEYRWRSAQGEIKASEGDVICLQEVQGDYYESHIRPWFEARGFEGVYKAKDRDGMMQGKVDGCATFWRRSKLALVEAQTVSFNDLATRYVQSLGYRKDDNTLLSKLKKDNIAQFTVLEIANARGGGHSRICVANTHFYSNKDHPEIKLWQAWQLTQALEEVSAGSSTRPPPLFTAAFVALCSHRVLCSSPSPATSPWCCAAT